MNATSARWLKIAIAGLLLIVVGGFAAWQFALHTLKAQIEAALGERGEVRELRVGAGGVEIIGLRVRAPNAAGEEAAWPTADELRAERILVVPAFGASSIDHIVLRRISVEGANIVLLRGKRGGVQLLPSLLTTSSEDKADKKTALPPLSIERIDIADSTLDFFDASIRQPPLELRLEKLSATLSPLKLPDLAGNSQLQLSAILKGVRQDGSIDINGTLALASRDSQLAVRLRQVDLLVLQPYLIKSANTGVRRGTLDLDLDPVVKNLHLHAPGTLTLHGLELAPGNDGRFMGLPRDAAIALLRDKQQRISMRFELDGKLDDPSFSLNESLARRVGAAFAETLGISIEGLAQGVGSAGSSVARGISDSLGKLLQR